MNIESLIYSLLLGAVSGLTFLAYRHPAAYYKIFSSVLSLLILIPLAIIVANGGHLYTLIRTLAKRLEDDPEQSISRVSYSINTINESLTTITLTVVVWFAVFGYLWFLYKLPSIIESNDE